MENSSRISKFFYLNRYRWSQFSSVRGFESWRLKIKTFYKFKFLIKYLKPLFRLCSAFVQRFKLRKKLWWWWQMTSNLVVLFQYCRSHFSELNVTFVEFLCSTDDSPDGDGSALCNYEYKYSFYTLWHFAQNLNKLWSKNYMILFILIAENSISYLSDKTLASSERQR